MTLRKNIEDHRRVVDSQMREIMPQFVRQVEAIMGPRDAQIVALGQSCEALINNQNFLLQNGMGVQTIQHPMPPRSVVKTAAGPDGSQSRGMPRANPDAPAAARTELEQAHDLAIIEARHLVASARQRLSAPAGFTYTYPKSVKGESEIKGAYAQENFARSGRDSALSLDDGSNPSLISQPAATRQMSGRNRPVGRLVAPESVPPPRAGTMVPRLHRRHRSSTPEQGRRAATPPVHPRQRSRTPQSRWNPPPVSQ
jgi:hypothetical protein